MPNQHSERAAEVLAALREQPELEDEAWTLVGKLRLEGNGALADALVKALRSLERGA